MARQDPVFRKALAQCWAYTSPMYDHRADLLIERGASDDDCSLVVDTVVNAAG